MEKRYTPEFITELQPGEIFVFGSNLAGAHGGGAARIAYTEFGAVWGQGTGLQGQSYGIPTMHGGVDAIKPYVDEFIAFAERHREFTFLVTRIGCGIAGFRDEEIAPLFRAAAEMENVILPREFAEVIGRKMLAYTYVEKGHFELMEKDIPKLLDPRDAIVKVTLASICTSDLHIKQGCVPRAVPGITVGHEIVGIVEHTGCDVHKVRPGDRVAVNVETFCGECFFCRHGYVNNCSDPDGGWSVGCRIDGGQAEYIRVPHADRGLSLIPDGVSDGQALFAGDILATGYWAAKISEIREGDTVLVIGAGPTGICSMLCSMLKHPGKIIVCEKDRERADFVREHYPSVLVTGPEHCRELVLENSAHGGADAVMEVAGSNDSFRLAWECARPNAIVTIVAMYDSPQILPLPDMYGKNLIFKTGGVDGCDCDEILRLISQGVLDTTPLVTHRFPLDRISEAYRIFENREDGVIKIAVSPPETV